MRRSRRVVPLALLFTGAVVVALRLSSGRAYPIEGIWKSALYCECLCDSQNLFLFEDGMITRYSDGHETSAVGTYNKVGGGFYRVVFTPRSSSNGWVWMVRPGKRSWVPAPDQDKLWTWRLVARFYRPLNSKKSRALISSAPARDERFRNWRQRTEVHQSRS